MLNRLLITGAAGRVASLVTPRLGEFFAELRLSDLSRPETMPEGSEFVPCDLQDLKSVKSMVEGCDGIVHLGGIAEEDTFGAILSANIEGVHNLYEAARLCGRPRIIFASSNHVIGFYRQDQRLDAHACPRPDSLYGVSKVFGEAMADLYHRKFGIETAILRIGSCFEAPVDRRMLATWFSAADFARLIERVFRVHRLGCPVIYGVSDNDSVWWDNASASYLGWVPRDSSRHFAAMFADERLAADDPRALYQGGLFTKASNHGEQS